MMYLFEKQFLLVKGLLQRRAAKQLLSPIPGDSFHRHGPSVVILDHGIALLQPDFLARREISR